MLKRGDKKPMQNKRSVLNTKGDTDNIDIQTYTQIQTGLNMYTLT